MARGLASIDRLAAAHGRRLRLAVLPVAVAATVLTVVGKGLGWRVGGIAVLAAVAIWAYLLYFLADQRCERISKEIAAFSTIDANSIQLHQHVCETKEYWEYLRGSLAEVANTGATGILGEPTRLPATSEELGQGFTGAERLLREWLDHLAPPKSRYVVYYVFNDEMQASAEIHSGWKGRPPDLRHDSVRHNLLLTMVKLGTWVVLPDVGRPEPGDEKFVPLCFDRTDFHSFACLPLRVEEPASSSSYQRNGLAVGALIVESPTANGLTENFCGTAIQVAGDILALSFANARANFGTENGHVKRSR